MEATAIINTLLYEEFTQKNKNNDDKTRHLINILSYNIKKHNVNNFTDLIEDCDKKIEDHLHLPSEEASFERFDIPEIKKYPPFDYKNYFTKTQNWICHVTDIYDKTFKAKLEEINSPYSTYEIAEFDIDEIDENDKELFRVGAIFYWSVGFEYRNGTKSRNALMRFKRLPQWTTTDIDSAKDLADDLFENINWD